MALAAATPRHLAASVAGLDEARLGEPLEPGEWSLAEILNHLLAHENPRLEEIHPRQWIKAVSPY